MRSSNASLAAIFVALLALSACGQQSGSGNGFGASSGGSGSGGGSGGSGGGSGGSGGGSGGLGPFGGWDASMPAPDAGGVGSSSGGPIMLTPALGSAPYSDCPGCMFPPATAMPCPSTVPAIKLVYPNDTVLVPPNLNVMSVHWTPYGAPYTKFSVDFTSPPNTDWHIVTACQNPTIDAQSNAPSGGCEVIIDPVSWSKLVGANRGQGPVTISVRGTTDGTCATPSTNQIQLSFAEEDLIGTYYYWKSTVTAAGVGGQIWKKAFGDLNTAEVDVTTPAIPAATCNGCHSLSRDGSRMVVYSDDADSDDEYTDIAGSLLDMTITPATEFLNTGITGPARNGQPPGFSTINPLASHYVTSNGFPYNCTVPGVACGTAAPFPSPVPSNGFSLWDATNANFVGGVTIGPANTRPTMPDWSVDGKVVVYVVPAGAITWAGQLGTRADDDHIYGGSLYTVPYTGNGTFGAPALLLNSTGENNYYPSYSPDVPMSYVIFDRVDNMGKGAACANGFCPDDSFSNPAARLMLIGAGGGTPIDLEKANGSPLAAKLPWSNSYPRWAPFVQTYQGQKLLWFTFSSTRDYGVRVLNHKTGMYQCYPADAPQTPNAKHRSPFVPQCQEPQLWMAPINLSEAQGNRDPSRVAFWLPYQDITTHNHTAQWTQQQPPQPTPVDAGIPPCSCQMNVYGACGAANGGCGCCTGTSLVCSGNSICVATPM